MISEQRSPTLKNPTREQVLDAIYHANDKASVREAQRLVRYWVEENPDDTEIPLAAQRLSDAAMALISGENPNEGATTSGTTYDTTRDATCDATKNSNVAPYEGGDTRDTTGGDVSWVSVAEAAKLLQITPRSVQRRCDTGSLKARRVGPEGAQHWEIDPASLSDARRDTTRQAAPTVAPQNTISNRGNATHDATLNRVSGAEIEAISSQMARLSNEVEQLKAFIAGGAMQALNERLATLPDTDTIRALIVENQAQIVSVAVAQAVAATQENAQQQVQQQAEERRAEMSQAVQDGITAALQTDIEREAEQQAQTANKDDVKGIVDRLEKVLERQQWLEEDNANLRKELAEQRTQGFFGRLFGKKGQDRGG